MNARRSSDAAMVSEIANRFDVVLQAARKMLEKDRIRLFPYTPQAGAEAHAWTMLVRALNLGESATQAARAGYGETVALIARCLEEMAYTVACLGSDLAGAKDFVRHGLARQKKTAERLANAVSSEADKIANQETIRRIEQILGKQPDDWGKRVEARAAKAGMIEDYAISYGFLSEQAHSDSHALLYYAIRAGDGYEVHPKIRPTAVATYLLIATDFFGRVLSMLLEIFDLPHQKVYQSALQEFDEFEQTLDTKDWMKMPVDMD